MSGRMRVEVFCDAAQEVGVGVGALEAFLRGEAAGAFAFSARRLEDVGVGVGGFGMDLSETY